MLVKAYCPNVYTVAKVPLMKLMKCGATVLSKIALKETEMELVFSQMY